MNEKKIGIGVVGAGFISGYHLNGLACVENTIVRIICDRDVERARSQAKRFNIDETTKDVQDVIEREDVQAVLILTPNNTHRDLAIQVCSAGKHVMVQKPFARSTTEVREMINAASQNNVLLVPSFMHRFMEETIVGKDMISRGLIGRILGAHIRNGVPGPLHSEWFFNPEATGGGAVIDIGVHGIDLLRYLVGEPIKVSAFVRTGCSPRKLINGKSIAVQSEDLGSVIYCLNDGTVASQDISWCQYKGSDRFSMEIYGDEGTIYLRSEMGRLSFSSERNQTPSAWIIPQLPNVPFGYKQHKAFIDAILGITPYPVTPLDGLATISVAEAIYQSVSEGRAISISCP